jgi:hypothetical protein
MEERGRRGLMEKCPEEARRTLGCGTVWGGREEGYLESPERRHLERKVS